MNTEEQKQMEMVRRAMAEEIFASVFPGRTCSFDQLNETWHTQITNAVDACLAKTDPEGNRLLEVRHPDQTLPKYKKS